jgi:hypothetical protein
MAMALARLLALVLLVVAMPALAADPHPPQFAVSFLAEPAPIVQDGSTRPRLRDADRQLHQIRLRS